MHIQKIGTTIRTKAQSALEKSLARVTSDVEIPRLTPILKITQDKYGNFITEHENNLSVIHHKNGSKIYIEPKQKIVIDKNSEVRTIETPERKEIFFPNGKKITLSYESQNGKKLANAAEVYTEKYPDGLIIEGITTNPKGQVARVITPDNKYIYYSVQANDKIKSHNRGNLAKDEELFDLVSNGSPFAAVPAALLRAAVLGKI